MALTEQQITQATTIRNAVNDHVNDLCVSRDSVDHLLRMAELCDQTTGGAWLVSCRNAALADAQAIADVLTP